MLNTSVSTMFNYQGATRSQIWTFLVSLTSLSILALLLSPSIGPSRYGSEPQLGMPSIIAPPYTAVILYLVTLSRVSELLDSLASINTNLPGPPWPIVLFHTGDFDGEHQRLEFIAQVRSHIGQENGSFQFAERIEFARLDWRLPEGISTDKDIVDPVDAHRWPGYHHMCAFFATEIFSTPRLKDVTYYMRMDTDSQITEPLCYDPFEVMHVRGRSYGYLAWGHDPPQVTVGMWGLVNDYALAHASVAKQLLANHWQWPSESWPHENAGAEEVNMRFRGYFSNFEVVKLEDFRRSDVASWLAELMSVPERIFKWRWGDAPIRYATVQMFFDSDKSTELFCGMRYFHPFTPHDECICIPL